MCFYLIIDLKIFEPTLMDYMKQCFKTLEYKEFKEIILYKEYKFYSNHYCTKHFLLSYVDDKQINLSVLLVLKVLHLNPLV